MVTFSDAAKSAIKGAYCSWLRQAGNANSWLKSRLGIPNAGGLLDPGWVTRRLCDDPDPVPDAPPSFTGGQCPGVRYTVRGSAIPGTSNQPISGLTNILGPITSLTFSPASQEPFGGGSGPATAVPLVVTFSGVGAEGPFSATRSFGTSSSARTVSASVTRNDGQADNCGDPPATVPDFPPSGTPVPISITYNTFEGDEITEEGDLRIFAPVFAPVIGSFNTLTAPFTLNLGGLTIDGTLSLEPEFNIQFGGGGSDGPPGNTPGPDSPVEPGTDDPSPDDDSELRLIGVFVRCTFTGPISPTRLFASSGPDLFVPRLGTVSFRVRSDGALGWSEPFDIKHTSQYFPVPLNLFAVRAEADGGENVAIALRPVYERRAPSGA